MNALPNELILIIESFLDTSSAFSLKNTSRFFNAFISKIHVEFNHPMLFKTRINTVIDATKYSNLFRWLIPNPECLSLRYATCFCEAAAANGNLDIVKYMPENVWTRIDPDTICSGAVKGGHFDTLKWLHNKYSSLTHIYVKGFYGTNMIPNTDDIKLQVENNYLQICHETFAEIIRQSRLDILMWMHEQGYVFDPTYTVPTPIGGPNRADLMDIVKWISDNSHELYDSLYAVAAECGRMDILQYLHENGYESNENACERAAEYGHFEILKWLHANGFPWDEYTCGGPAKNGHFKILQWLHENGCPLNEDTCANAAAGGHLDILKWLREKGCPWSEDTFSEAVTNGDFEMLEWLWENKCPWDELSCAHAVEGHHLDILKWLCEKECPWDDYSCECAAINGDLEMLKWLRGRGCPWGQLASVGTAEIGDFEMIKWLREQGCPINVMTHTSAIMNDHLELAKWIKENVLLSI